MRNFFCKKTLTTTSFCGTIIVFIYHLFARLLPFDESRLRVCRFCPSSDPSERATKGVGFADNGTLQIHLWRKYYEQETHIHARTGTVSDYGSWNVRFLRSQG